MSRAVGCLLLVVCAAGLGACTDRVAGPADDALGELVAAVGAGEVELIDVRTPEEFAGGHVDGAVNLDFSSPDFPELVAGLDPDAAYAVYCATGTRSASAARAMREGGIEDVTDVGGIDDLEAAGARLVTGS